MIKNAVREHNRTQPKKLRADASVAFETIMSFTPGAVQGNDIIAWANESLKWWRRRYPTAQLLRYDLHMDEETPHLHVIALSTARDGRLSSKALLGEPDQLRNDQTAYAQAVARFGLSRGEPKETTRSKHKTISQHRAEKLQEAESEALAIKHTAQKEAAELVSEARETLHAAGREALQIRQSAIETAEEIVTEARREALGDVFGHDCEPFKIYDR